MTVAFPVGRLKEMTPAPRVWREEVAAELYARNWPKHKICRKTGLTAPELDDMIRRRQLPPRLAPKKHPWHKAGERHRPHGRPTHRCPRCQAESLERDRCRTTLPDGSEGGCGFAIGHYYDQRRGL